MGVRVKRMTTRQRQWCTAEARATAVAVRSVAKYLEDPSKKAWLAASTAVEQRNARECKALSVLNAER